MLEAKATPTGARAPIRTPPSEVVQELHPLRKNCSCGGELGIIKPKNGQDCLYCVDCSRWQYNVPRRERAP